MSGIVQLFLFVALQFGCRAFWASMPPLILNVSDPSFGKFMESKRRLSNFGSYALYGPGTK